MQLEDVYKLYYRDVFYYLLSMTGDAQTAEDLTQETFYRALKYIDRFKGECHFKTWLCRIGKNVYISWKKKQKRLTGGEVNLENINETEVKVTASEEKTTPESRYILKEEALAVYRILHILEEPYKEVFILRTLGELSYREIGEIFGHGEGWARITHYRAKIKIQEMMKEES